jgi:hypothetical protein
MIDMRVCTKGVGFACVASLATVALTSGAFAQGGDNPTSATAIGALPFADTGTTVGYTNDSDEVCPFTGSSSPDVYYSYSPASDQQITVDLCDSMYDTKTYVYDSFFNLADTRPAGAPACNDDFCTAPNGGPFRSFLECINVFGGNTYYIVVDGWLGDLGGYQIDVTVSDPAACGPCIVECPAGANIEPDDCDFGNPAPNDQVNGGCNATPPAFTEILCDKWYCGTGYFDGAFRDTDWWELAPLAGSATFTIKGQSEFDSVYGRVENGGVPACPVLAFAEFVVLSNCTDAALVTAELIPGTYWFFVGPQFTDLVDCNQPAGGPPAEIGENYTLRVNCELTGLPCPWDFNGDEMVGFADLLKVLSNWGPCPTLP